MITQVDITPMDGYLYVEVSGRGTYKGAVELWQTIAEACKKHQCFNVLGIQRVTIAVDTLTALDHQTIFTDLGIDSRYRIAWVDENPRTYESIEFIKNVLANRSIGYGKVFTNQQDAKTWLLTKLRK